MMTKTKTATETLGAKGLKFIESNLDDGRTVYVQTMTKTTVIDKKTADDWAAAGHILFKLVNGDLYMARGNTFDALTSGVIAHVKLTASDDYL